VRKRIVDFVSGNKKLANQITVKLIPHVAWFVCKASFRRTGCTDSLGTWNEKWRGSY